MKDVLPAIEEWRARGERVAVATVVKTLGSAPRGVGAKMVVSSGGSMAVESVTIRTGMGRTLDHRSSRGHRTG